MKHTKGPWKINREDNEGNVALLIGDDFCVNLCEVIPGSYTNETREANANLIAAAPELLEVAHYAMNMALDLDKPNSDIEAIQKAINKAEGRER